MGWFWRVEFDAAAVVVLLTVFVWYFIEKRIPVISHKVFLVLWVHVFLATSFEIMCYQLKSQGYALSSDTFMWFFSMQAFFVYMVLITFVWYTLTLANVDKNEHKILKLVIHVITGVVALIHILNPITKWAYYFEGKKYSFAWASAILVSCSVILLCQILYIIKTHLNELTYAKSRLLLFDLLICFLAIPIEIKLNFSLLCFAMTMVILSLYQYLQNPAKMLDSTTKVFNRSFFNTFVVNKFLSKKRFGIIVLAMDDFKFINKTYGVSNGDQMLVQVAAYLKTYVSEGFRVFRLGSDQFCLVGKKEESQLVETAERIKDRFRHPWYGDNSAGIMMSASMCYIECPKNAETLGELVEIMDYSMAIAKKTKKGGVSKADELMLERLKEDKAIEKAVKLAIDRDELMVYYQPIFSVSHDAYNSAEALVRLKDDELGWISPEKFIPIAEKNGMIVQMGEVILEKVCRFIRDFKIADTTIEYIEVNISPIQLAQKNFVERVKAILEKYDVKPNQINMEITEMATLSGSDVVDENIGELVDYGIKFSLDDYGSGNANIDYINKMPFSIIKLDKYIVWDSFKNQKAGITLEYTIGMLNALKLYIVAEGVETEEMKSQLEKIGCHYLQGWYYSKAVDQDEFMTLLEKSA